MRCRRWWIERVASVSGSVLLLIVPLLGAALAWLLSRWPRFAVAVGTLAAWLLGFWLWRLPLPEAGEVVSIYGRSLTLTSTIQTLFVWLLAILGVLFLLSLSWPQGRYFVPAGLAFVSPMAAALLIRPLTLGALFGLIAAIFMGVFIQSDRAGRTQGAWRYVLLLFLAVSLLLAGGWMAETEQTALRETAGRLLAVAFLILLAGFPFHIWVQPVVTAVPGLSLAVVLGLGQMLLTIFVYEWIAAFPWLQQGAAFQMIIQGSALLTALTAGVLALTSRNWLRLLGSVLLLDMAVSLALLLIPTAEGRETAVLLLAARFLSLLFVAVGRPALLRLENAKDGSVLPLGTGAVLSAFVAVYGLISALGFPLTIGFSGRWTAVSLLAHQPGVMPWLPIGILLAMGGGILGIWRQLAAPLMRTGLLWLKDKILWQQAVVITGAAGLIWLVFVSFVRFFERLSLF